MSALKRVLVALEPGKDGVFVAVRGLVRFLMSEHPEIQVDLAYSSRRQLGGADELAEEVRCHGGEAIDLEVANAPEPGDFPAAARIFGLVKRRRPQIVHCHSSKAGALCRLLALTPGFPPTLYTPHAYYGVGCAGGRREFVYNTIEKILGRVGTTACCSQDEKAFAEDVLHLDPARLVVVNNGIDIGVFAPATSGEKRTLRRKLDIPDDGRLLVTIGRDSAQKNYGPLYAAVEQLFSHGSDFRFAHAGEGSIERRNVLPAPAQERVHAFSHLRMPQDLMRAADGFVLTSAYEGLSLSMLEALSCGTPLLLTDVPGLRTVRDMVPVRWLRSPREGLTTNEIADAISDWNQSDCAPDLAQRAVAVEQFDQKRQYGRMVELYRSMA